MAPVIIAQAAINQGSAIDQKEGTAKTNAAIPRSRIPSRRTNLRPPSQWTFAINLEIASADSTADSRLIYGKNWLNLSA